MPSKIGVKIKIYIEYIFMLDYEHVFHRESKQQRSAEHYGKVKLVTLKETNGAGLQTTVTRKGVSECLCVCVRQISSVENSGCVLQT